MKGNKRLLMAALVAVLCLIAWSITPRVSAERKGEGDKKAKSESRSSKKSDKKSESGKKGSAAAKSSASGKAGLNSAEAGESEAAEEMESDGDADIPPFVKNKPDKETYLRMREQQENLMRGIEPGKPFDFTLRGRAITQMEHQQAAIMEAARKSAGTNKPLIVPQWLEVGPSPIPNGQTQTVTNPVSGRVTAIEIDPTNSLNVYVGTANGGLYRSLDGGTTWTQLFDSAQTLAIGALALAPSDPTKLYVGTGEPNGSADSYPGIGLYRIDNVTTTASLVGPINPVRTYTDVNGNPQNVAVFNGRSISKILVHPTDPSVVFVGTAGGATDIGGNAPLGGTVPPLGLRGLYRLANATAANPNLVTVERIRVTTVVTAGPPPSSPAGGCFDNPCTGNRNINDMVFEPGNPNTLIVWQNGINVAGDGGVFVSTNALATPATAITFTQTFITTSTSTSNGRGEFAIYKEGANPAVVYEASGETSTGTSCTSTAQRGALRVSTDGGLTWSNKLTGGGGFCGGQCFYNIGLDVRPGATTAQNDDQVYLGGNVSSASCQRLFALSTDGGNTFTNADSGLHADTHVVRVDPTNPAIVYHGDDGGIFKTTNSGATWTSLNNSMFRATQFVGFDIHPTSRNFSLGGTQDNGTNLRDSTGVWRRVDFGDGGFAVIDQNSTSDTTTVMYHTYFNQTNNLIAYARHDGGSTATEGTWNTFGCNTGIGNGINCANAVNFYAPLTRGPNAPDTQTPTPHNPIYFGTDTLYRSPDMGPTNVIVSQSPLVTGVPISAIGISRNNDNVRMVGLNNGAIFYTLTGSSTLTSLDPTGAGSVIPNNYITRVVFDPNNDNIAYITLGGYLGGSTATTASHVWKATNLNSTPVITAINGGGGASPLPDVPVNSIFVDPASTNTMFLGTDIGVYATFDGGATWAPFGTGLPVVPVWDLKIQNNTRVLRIATHGRGMWEIPAVPPTAINPSLRGQVLTSDGKAVAGVTMTLTSGDNNIRTITDKNGVYSFEGLSASQFYTITPSLSNYSFNPGNRSYSLTADVTDAVFTANAAPTAIANPTDEAEFFVRQHYIDFLGREPDIEGLRYWSNQLRSCGTDEACTRQKRTSVSAAFFLSQEFHDTGFFVYNMYRASFAQLPSFDQFTPDRLRVVGGANLSQSKQQFASEWVNRESFKAIYPEGLTNEQYVSKLLQYAGLSNGSLQEQLTAEMGAGKGRAEVLQEVAENKSLQEREFNRAFVLMQYFGYLRRNPEQDGLNFWLNVLSNREPGNFRGMVCSFITSAEYQLRFSSYVAHSNQECGQ